jgi:hypothetical protein
VATFRKGVRAIQLVGRASESKKFQFFGKKDQIQPKLTARAKETRLKMPTTTTTLQRGVATGAIARCRAEKSQGCDAKSRNGAMPPAA